VLGGIAAAGTGERAFGERPVCPNHCGKGEWKDWTLSVETRSTHSVKLNRTAYDYAQELIKSGHRVLDGRDDWSEHQPSAAEENRFIE
jgi:hypothetical protein